MKMENTARINRIFGIMKVLTWVAFTGLCVKAGALLFSFLVSIFVSAEATKHLYLGLDLYDVQVWSIYHYLTMAALILIPASLKAYMFYFVIKIFSDINLERPFNESMACLIAKISYVALIIGLFTLTANSYALELVKHGIQPAGLNAYTHGGAEFLFLAGIVFIISTVFRKGIELQMENEQTV